jgi:hypothetical protein
VAALTPSLPVPALTPSLPVAALTPAVHGAVPEGGPVVVMLFPCLSALTASDSFARVAQLMNAAARR